MESVFRLGTNASKSEGSNVLLPKPPYQVPREENELKRHRYRVVKVEYGNGFILRRKGRKRNGYGTRNIKRNNNSSYNLREMKCILAWGSRVRRSVRLEN